MIGSYKKYLVLLSIFFILFFSSLATAEKKSMSKPELKVDDTWNYQVVFFKDGQEYPDEVTCKVEEKTALNVNGELYEIYKIVTTAYIGSLTNYLDTETLATVRSIQDINLPDFNGWNVTYANFESIFPLYVNKTVNWTTERIYDEDGKSETVYVEKKCTEIVDIVTPAGTFECFKVETYYDGSLDMINYWSPEVRYHVKHVYYNENGSIDRESTFLSFGDSEPNIPSEPRDEDDIDSRYFLIGLLGFLIIILLFFLYKLHQSKKK